MDTRACRRPFRLGPVGRSGRWSIAKAFNTRLLLGPVECCRSLSLRAGGSRDAVERERETLLGVGSAEMGL